ncbi:unnamed protein product [Rotaria sp. Silwood2]|nr:unnamed protein product [Rotaria sp. Silwood2]CAF4088184.1 unnamed protein product [Rotaria sp. Silwood2]
MNHTIELKEDFTSEKLRINLNMPLKSTKQKDLKSLNKSINEDRKLVIQAAIIRIMKERKTLKHSLLMQEVLEHLSSRFKSENHLIKKCIDILIDKEYLERNSDNKEILHYLT